MSSELGEMSCELRDTGISPIIRNVLNTVAVLIYHKDRSAFIHSYEIQVNRPWIIVDKLIYEKI